MNMKKILSGLLSVLLLAQLITVPAYAAEPELVETFEEYAVDSTYNKEGILSSDLPSGATVNKRVTQERGGNLFLRMSAANTAISNGTARVRMRTVKAYSGTFTVQWDYKTPGSFARFETYLRTGGNVRVRVTEYGMVSLLVLDAAVVSGKMESAYGKVKLSENKWYTFKAEVSRENIVLQVYDREDTKTPVETLQIAQDNTTLATLFDAYNIWFDLWGNSNLSDTTPAVADLDNLVITEGTYEGLYSLRAKAQSANQVDRVSFWSENGMQTVDNLVWKTYTDGQSLYREGFESGTELGAGWTVEGKDTKIVQNASGDQMKLRDLLGGKTVSILGDSISTYAGYSDNPDYNTTLAGNRNVYPNSAATIRAEETWWMQVVNNSGMELLVNNSYSGDEINPNEDPGLGLIRCTQLHSDTGRDAGTQPDVILIYFGTNDAGADLRTPNNQELFRINYPQLMTKLASAYPQAEIFFFTLLPRVNFKVEPYNQIIRQVVEKAGNPKFHLVDLYEDSGINYDNLSKHTYDNLHPSANGMYVISRTVLDTLEKWARDHVTTAGGNVLELTGTGQAAYALDRAHQGTRLTFDWQTFRAQGVGLYNGGQPVVQLRTTKEGAIQAYDGNGWVDAGATALEANRCYTVNLEIPATGDKAQLYLDGKFICDLPVMATAQAEPEADSPVKSMTDVAADAWYYKAVDYVMVNKLMNGFSATTFGPDKTLTRAQVVQVLYNKEGQPAVSGAHGFTDVPADQWYNNAVTWGTQKKVMSGYGGGKFGPEDAVTVEQVLVILWNYAGNPALTGDADAVGPHSEWAGNAIGWAQAAGVLDHVPFDKVTEPANRAQTAQMLMNYLKK